MTGREEGLDGGGGGALGDGEELGSVDDETFIYRLIQVSHRCTRYEVYKHIDMRFSWIYRNRTLQC